MIIVRKGRVLRVQAAAERGKGGRKGLQMDGKWEKSGNCATMFSISHVEKDLSLSG